MLLLAAISMPRNSAAQTHAFKANSAKLSTAQMHCATTHFNANSLSHSLCISSLPSLSQSSPLPSPSLPLVVISLISMLVFKLLSTHLVCNRDTGFMNFMAIYFHSMEKLMPDYYIIITSSLLWLHLKGMEREREREKDDKIWAKWKALLHHQHQCQSSQHQQSLSSEQH